MFAARLRLLRQARGISQAEVAAVLGYTRNAISQYERGVNQPSHKDLLRLAQFFDVSIDYLLGLSEEIGNRTILDAKNPQARYPLLSPDRLEKMMQLEQIAKISWKSGQEGLITDDEFDLLLEIISFHTKLVLKQAKKRGGPKSVPAPGRDR